MSALRGRLGGLAAGVLVALAFGLLLLGSSGAQPTEDGARSTEVRGTRAAFLLLAELGFAPEEWHGAPGDLPRGQHLLWLRAVPPTPLALSGEGTPPRSAASAAPARDPRLYRRFLEEGGTVLLGLSEVDVEFLRESLELPLPAELAADSSAAAGRVLLLPDEWLDVPAGMRLAGLPAAAHEAGFDVRALTADGAPVVAVHPVGRGALVLLPTDSFAENAGIAECDGALLLVRLVEAFAPGGRVLFDEYALGAWQPEGTLDLALSPRLAGLTLHALLLLLVLAWRVSFRRDFARESLPERELSPGTRARALAVWLVRARRPDLLGEMLRAGVRRRLARRAGLRGDPALLDAAGSDAPEPPPALAAALPASGAVAGSWTRLFAGPLPRSAAELEHLGAELVALERAALSARSTTKEER